MTRRRGGEETEKQRRGDEAETERRRLKGNGEEMEKETVKREKRDEGEVR